MNFIAKFDIDEFSTDLALEAKDYDTSYSAGYESWMQDAARVERAAVRDGRRVSVGACSMYAWAHATAAYSCILYREMAIVH